MAYEDSNAPPTSDKHAQELAIRRLPWKWPKMFGLWVSATALFAVVALNAESGLQGYDRWRSRTSPQLETTLLGVTLGQSDEDVRVQLGDGYAQTDQSGNLLARLYRDARRDVFGDENTAQFMIRFGPTGRVEVVVIFGTAARNLPEVPVLLGDSVADVKEWWGQPTSERTWDYKGHGRSGYLTRLYTFSNRGAFVEVREGKVIAIGIFSKNAESLIPAVGYYVN